ncbi:MAG: hypothetical protein KC983_04910 [Phycisphaerales bacterium]|nr:hypothetical protein [Phycisphaerales bacterium]
MDRTGSTTRMNSLRVSATTLAALIAMTSSATLAATLRTLGGTSAPPDTAVRAVAAAMAAMAWDLFGTETACADAAPMSCLCADSAHVASMPSTFICTPPRHLSERLLDLPPPARLL